MAVRIRLARFGCRNRPFYRLVVAESSCRRDGKHVEFVGFYDPLPGEDGDKRMGLKYDRIRYWLSVGAQPSEAAERILRRAGVFPPPPVLAKGHKDGPSDSLPIDPLTGSFVTPKRSFDADHVKDVGRNANEDTPNTSDLSINNSLWCNIGFPVSETNFN